MLSGGPFSPLPLLSTAHTEGVSTNSPPGAWCIQESMITEVFALEQRQYQPIPLYGCAVSAGFPSPADDHLDKKLDLNELLIENPAATFFVRATGDSMEPAGIFDGDILIVDRSIKAKNGRVIVAVVNGELTVKRVQHYGLKTFLAADNTKYPPIEITEFCELHCWGVVIHVLHKMR